MNLIRKFKSLVYCNLLYHEGFNLNLNGEVVYVCEHCRKSFMSKQNYNYNMTAIITALGGGREQGLNNLATGNSLVNLDDLVEDKENKLFTWYLDKTNGMVDNPKRLTKEDFQLIKICHPELEEYAKLWKDS